MTNPTIEDVFALLDKWRGFPAYQLERRADIYFALFLPLVLKEQLKLEAEPVLIPEFPLRHGTLGTNVGSIGENQSVKVDYIAVSREDNKVFLVELKTAMSSRRTKQDEYLRVASAKSFKDLVNGVHQLSRASDQKKKYQHLLDGLEQIGISKLSQDLKPQVVYVQPKKGDKDANTDIASYISFDKFADKIEGRGEIAERFAKSLEEWQKPPA